MNAHKSKLKLKLIPLNKLDVHNLNPNEISETCYQKLKENIGRTGRYPALIVRPKGDRYEILDGHKRALVLKELGYIEAKCEVWNVNDREAKLLLATLNRLRGVDDTKKRARLIAELIDDFGKENILRLLPESQRAIDGLLESLKDNDVDIEKEIELERGLIEEKLLQGGIDDETAELMANLYQPPSTKPVLKFVFDDERKYNKAVKFFGKKGDPDKLIALIENYEKK